MYPAGGFWTGARAFSAITSVLVLVVLPSSALAKGAYNGHGRQPDCASKSRVERWLAQVTGACSASPHRPGPTPGAPSGDHPKISPLPTHH